MNTLMRQTFGRNSYKPLELLYAAYDGNPYERIGKTKENKLLGITSELHPYILTFNKNDLSYDINEDFDNIDGTVNFASGGTILSSNGSIYSYPITGNRKYFRRMIYKITTNPNEVYYMHDTGSTNANGVPRAVVEDTNNIMWFFPKNLGVNVVKINSADDSKVLHQLTSVDGNYNIHPNSAVSVGNYIYLLVGNTATENGILKIDVNTNAETFYPSVFPATYLSLEIGSDGNLYSAPLYLKDSILKFDITTNEFSYVSIPAEFTFNTTTRCSGFAKLWNGDLLAYPVNDLDGFTYAFNAEKSKINRYDISGVNIENVNSHDYITFKEDKITYLSSNFYDYFNNGLPFTKFLKITEL